MQQAVCGDSGCSVAADATVFESSVFESSHLSDAAATAYLAASKGVVMVEASTQDCVPCRLLRPIVAKHAVEFAGRLAVIALDETAAEFLRTYRIDRLPQLLFFVDGRYRSRQRGFASAARTRRKVINVLGIVPDATPSARERAFRKACARATARMDAIMAPASAALEPHIASVAAASEKFEAALKKDVAAGRIDGAEAGRRRRAEYARLYAPFQDKIAALRVSQTEALAIYEATMSKAVQEFARASDLREAA
jgi:hypothetical protein